jgi:hypothetical protein
MARFHTSLATDDLDMRPFALSIPFHIPCCAFCNSPGYLANANACPKLDLSELTLGLGIIADHGVLLLAARGMGLIYGFCAKTR